MVKLSSHHPSSLIARVSRNTPESCHGKRCKKHSCALSLQNAPEHRLVIDLDCTELGIEGHAVRCDLVVFAEESMSAWVIPIEFKSGHFKPMRVFSQLQAGATLAQKWVPADVSFRLVPILVHKKGIPQHYRNVLRKQRVKMHEEKRVMLLSHCGGSLRSLIEQE